MKLIDNILYLSTLDFEGFEVSESTVNNGTSENRKRHGVGSWRHIEDPTDNRKTLVDFDYIPTQTQNTISKVICRQEGLKQINSLKNYLIDICGNQATSENLLRFDKLVKKAISEDTKEFYISQRLNSEKAAELTKCDALLSVLAKIRTKAQIEALDLEGISLKTDLYALAIKWLLNNGIKALPTTYDRLSRKANQYSKLADRNERLVMIAGKSLSLKNNTNNQKLSDPVQKFILNIWLFYDDLNPKPGSIKLLPHDVHHVYELNRASNKKIVLNKETSEVIELPEISLSSVKNVIYRNPIVAAARHGNKYINDKFRFIVQGKLPQYSLSMLSMDDMDSSFPMKHANKEIRPKLYFVFDVATGYIVGWDMAAVYRHKNDTPMKSLIAKVTSKAIFNMNYRLPIEWQMEKHATGDFKSTLLSNFENVDTSDYTGKVKVKDYQESEQSKFAEKYIDRFQNEVERLKSGWKGQGIMSRKADSHPNRELVTKVFTHEQLIDLYNELVDTWNNNAVSQKDSTPRHQAFNERQNKEALQMTERKFAHTFGRSTFQTIGNHKTSQRGYVEPIFNGIEYTYIVPNYYELLGKVTNQGRVRVVQNPYDTAKCWLFEYDNKDEDNLHKDIFLCECTAAERVQRSSAESTDNDSNVLGSYLKTKDQFNDFLQSELEEVKAVSEYDMMEEDAEFVINSPYDKEKHDNARKAIENKRIEIYGGGASEDEVLPD